MSEPEESDWALLRKIAAIRNDLIIEATGAAPNLASKDGNLISIDIPLRDIFLSHPILQSHLERKERLAAAVDGGSEMHLPFVQRGIVKELIDPAKTGKPAVFSEYYGNWAYAVVRNVIDAQGWALELFSILDERRNEYGLEEMKAVVQKLWRSKWLFGYLHCGDLQYHLSSAYAPANGGSKRFWQLEQDWCLDCLRKDLDHARETANDLDQWLDDLHEIGYYVGYGLNLCKNGNAADSEKHHRFVDEVGADIGSLYTTFFVSNILLNHPGIFNGVIPAGGPKPNEDLPALRKKLSYCYRARVFYPKFFHDRAIDYLINATCDRAAWDEACRYDKRHLASVCVAYFGPGMFEQMAQLHKLAGMQR